MPKRFSEAPIKARDGYVRPLNPFIGRGDETEALYCAEENVHKAIDKATRELMKVLQLPETVYWKVAMPEALRTILEGYDTSASILAAASYLEQCGYTITPDPEDRS